MDRTTRCTLEVSCKTEEDYDIATLLGGLLQNIDHAVDYQRDDPYNNASTFTISFPSRKEGQKAEAAIRKQQSFTIHDLGSSLICDHLMSVEDFNMRIFQALDDIEETSKAMEKKTTKQDAFVSFNQHVLEAIEQDRRLDTLKIVLERTRRLTESLWIDQTGEVAQRKLLELESEVKHEIHLAKTALPIYGYRNEIRKALDSRVVIVRGETGSGKSTQLVQYLLRDYPAKDNRHLLVCSEPRKLVASSLWRRVSEEVGQPGIVACDVGPEAHVSRCDSNRIVFTTHYSMLTKLAGDAESKKTTFLDQCSVIVVDEAHERTLQCDILLAVLRMALFRHTQLKLVVMSATLDIDKFTKFFEPLSTQTVDVTGRTFPVTEEYVEPEWEREPGNDQDSLIVTAVKRTNLLHQEFTEQGKDDGILVFLTCPEDCDVALNMFVRMASKRDQLIKPGAVLVEDDAFVAYSLHGQLSAMDQQRLFETLANGKRKVVFATNVAETSVTVAEIGCVVDCGKYKQPRFDPHKKLYVLETRFISQASAKQRAGRAGRTRAGRCVRLFTEESFRTFEPCVKPEIMISHLGSTLLQLLRFGVSWNVIKSSTSASAAGPNEQFRWLEEPEDISMDNAIGDLVRLRAIDTSYCLTKHGRAMAQLANELDPEVASLAIRAADEDLAFQGCALASMITVRNDKLFILSPPNRKAADRHGPQRNRRSHRDLVAPLKQPFVQQQSDLLTLLKIFHAWFLESANNRDEWCVRKHIQSKLMRTADETFRHVQRVLVQRLQKSMKVPTFGEMNESFAKLRRIIFETYVPQVAKLRYSPPLESNKLAEYLRCDTREVVRVHYLSLLDMNSGAKRQDWPEFVVFQRVLKVWDHHEQSFMVNCSEIDRNWLVNPTPEVANALNFDLESFLLDAKMEWKVEPEVASRFVGKLHTNIKELNNQLRKRFPNEEININMDKNRIVAYCSRETNDAVRTAIEERLRSIRQKIDGVFPGDNGAEEQLHDEDDLPNDANDETLFEAGVMPHEVDDDSLYEQLDW